MILRTRPALQQRGEPGLAVAGVVVDDGQVARALRDQRVDQLGRLPGAAEAADHHRRAVGDAFAAPRSRCRTTLSIIGGPSQVR